MSDDQLIAAAKMDSKLNGCTCRPDVTIVRFGYGIVVAQTAHDEDCPLADAGFTGPVIARDT